MVCIKLCAKNDSNGNPRRCYVLLDSDGAVVCAVDEGYEGLGALAAIPGASCITYTPVEFDTTPTEYRRLLREFPASRKPRAAG